MFGAGGGRGGGTPSQAPSQVPSQLPSRQASVRRREGSIDGDSDNTTLGGVPPTPSSPLMETYAKHRGQGLGSGLGQGSFRGRGLAGMSNVARTAAVMEEEILFEKSLSNPHANPHPNANLGGGGVGSATSSISEGIEEGGEMETGVGMVAGMGVGVGQGEPGHYPAVQFGNPQHAANRPTAPLPPGPPLPLPAGGGSTGTGPGTPPGGPSVEGRSAVAGGGGGGNSKGIISRTLTHPLIPYQCTY